MKSFEFFVPDDYKKYIEYLLANSRIRCEKERDEYETIRIILHKDKSYTYEKGVICREREWALVPYIEGEKILFKYNWRVR